MQARNRAKVLVLPGDGIGREVTSEAVRVLEWFAANRGLDCDLQHEEFGAEFYHRSGIFLKESVLADMVTADAVLFGAMGGSLELNAIPQDVRRQQGLLRVRREMELYANIRPIKFIPSLAKASPLKEEVARGVDLVVVRELIGGIYFGEPRKLETLPDGQRRGINTQVYTTSEIVRIGEIAFDLAQGRGRKVTSVDKANVLESSLLWREEIEALRKRKYPNIELNHLYVDNCAMQIVRNPRQFDVIVTDNLFGDILSDAAAVIGGSLGLLPSASLGPVRADGHRSSFYEPVHGSAPDIAGKGIANPLAAILSLAMALELSLGRSEDAHLLQRAVEVALETARTPDLAERGVKPVSTKGMTDAVIASLQHLSHDGNSARSAR
jgi:3-isopropylmalate dehydrogenase